MKVMKRLLVCSSRLKGSLTWPKRTPIGSPRSPIYMSLAVTLPPAKSSSNLYSTSS